MDLKNHEEKENEEQIIQKMIKKNLGKFYTEHYEYIFKEMNLPSYQNTNFVEPFVGKGHLLQFLEKYYQVDRSSLKIEYYDLESHIENTIVQDTIQTPPNYEDKFVITNPPFLARNKNDKKETYDMYGANDLYKCFIKTVIHGNCIGGLLILPINFWSSIRKNDIILRKMFIEKYKVKRMNLFEERVFKDTSFMVTAVLFEKREEGDEDYMIPTFIYPGGIEKNFEISEESKWMIGGDLYHLPQRGDIHISRVYDKEDGEDVIEPNTRIFLHALDDGKEKRIHLEYVEEGKELYIGKHSDRTFATLHITPPLTSDKQKELIQRFNTYLEDKRDEYHSMFLTNYRESKEYARKRISFQLVYEILNYLLSQ